MIRYMMKLQSSKNIGKMKTPCCLGCTLTTVLAFFILLSPLVCLILLCSATRFPPQIFGTNRDHFAAHVISPIPESVNILDVEADDLIVHPDVVSADELNGGIQEV